MTTLTFNFSSNAGEIARRLDEHARRELPRAIANGINRTTEEVAVLTRAKLPQQFRFRSDRTRRFFEMFIGRDSDQLATPQRLRSTVGIRAPLRGRFDNTRAVGILTKFQTGGVLSLPGGEPWAIPTDYLKSRYKSGFPTKEMYPKALGVLESRSIEGRSVARGLRKRELEHGVVKVRLLGKRRTFAIDPRYHRASNPTVYGVWQRRGRGRNSEPFLIWAYKQSIRVPKRITFLEDAEQHVRQNLAANVTGFLAAFAKRSRVAAFERSRRAR